MQAAFSCISEAVTNRVFVERYYSKSVFLTREHLDLFCNFLFANLHLPPLTSPNDQLETRIRCLPITPTSFSGSAFSTVPSPKNPTSSVYRKSNMAAVVNDAISTAAPTFSTGSTLE